MLYNKEELYKYYEQHKNEYKKGYYFLKGVGKIVTFKKIYSNKNIYVKESIRVNTIINRYISFKLYLTDDSYYNSLMADQYLYELLVGYNVNDKEFTQSLKNLITLKLNYIKKIRKIS